MVLRLAEQLDVPLRERNRILVAAGFAPVYPERSLDDPDSRVFVPLQLEAGMGVLSFTGMFLPGGRDHGRLSAGTSAITRVIVCGNGPEAIDFRRRGHLSWLDQRMHRPATTTM